MNPEPFFSIIVPTYNRAPLLERTINSILQQVFSDFELLLIDDGSTDNTRQVVESLQQGDSRIYYHYQENGERGAARNTGIRAARGQFMIFFDSDDEMKPQYLGILSGGIGQHPDYHFYATRYHYIVNGKELPSSTSTLPEGEYGLDLVLKGNPFSCNFCVRRAHPQLISFRESREFTAVEDWMFLVENLRSNKIYLIAADGLGMHQHDGRSMQQNGKLIQHRLNATAALEKDGVVTGRQLAILKAYSWYFCSIHAYLDNNRRQSLHFIHRAIGQGGVQLIFVKAYLKYLAGRKAVMAFK